MSNRAHDLSVILGCAGTSLSDDERSFFREVRPFGFILFARNVDTPEQLRHLTEDLRDCVDRDDAPIFIDQEGGRVQRLRPPHWRAAPPMKLFGDLYKTNPDHAREALALNIQLLSAELLDLGITVDCAPLLDISTATTHVAIGDRAISDDVEVVCDLGRVAAESFLAAGILPVIKHLPGHGRATVDSHKDLPRVSAPRETLSRTDFVPFRHLKDMPLAMTAHIVFEDIDPSSPATTSQTVIGDIIRKDIGFDGLLISDDLSMHALTGGFRDRAMGSLDAGCDLALHCNGDMSEMKAVVDGASALSDAQWAKWQAAKGRLLPPQNIDRAEARSRLNSLLAPLL